MNNRAAALFWVRSIHWAISVLLMVCVYYIYYSALIARINTLTILSIMALIGEGVVLHINDGVCPIRPIHDRLGDPQKGIFDVIIGERLAPYGMPFFFIISLVGVLLLISNFV